MPIVCIVNYDAAWGMEHVPAAMAFGPEQDVEVKWGNVRFDKIAEGYGAYAAFVERTEDIFPAVMLTDTANFRNPNYHRPTDTIDTLNLNFMVSVADAVTATVKGMARVLDA